MKRALKALERLVAFAASLAVLVAGAVLLMATLQPHVAVLVEPAFNVDQSVVDGSKVMSIRGAVDIDAAIDELERFRPDLSIDRRSCMPVGPTAQWECKFYVRL